jgi:hypothetical protein
MVHINCHNNSTAMTNMPPSDHFDLLYHNIFQETLITLLYLSYNVLMHQSSQY